MAEPSSVENLHYRQFGFKRKAAVTSVADGDGRQLRSGTYTNNPAGNVWVDGAFSSATNEALLKANAFKSRIHRAS